MKKYFGAVLILLLLFCTAEALAGTEEDIQFADALYRRGWFDWAEEVAVDLIDSHKTPQELKGWAAELHCLILYAWTRASGDDSYRQKADVLRTKYKKMFSNHDAWGGVAARFAELQRELQKAQDLTNKAEVEVDKDKKAALTAEALKIFEQLDKNWEVLIKDLRLEVAKYPPEEEWFGMREKMTPKDWEKLLDLVWQRDLGEYLYSTLFLAYGKVVAPDKKSQIIERGLKKFRRLLEGEPEHENDADPPAKGQDGPQEITPRTQVEMLTYKAEIGTGQCYLELGQFERAIESFDYMIHCELPYGLYKSALDIQRIIDIRLEAYFLQGFTFNKAKKFQEAVDIFTHPEVGMFSQSGKPISMDNQEMIEYWRDTVQPDGKKHPEVAFMPNIRENHFGKLASFQLAQAYAALGRNGEAIDEVYKVFVIEQETRQSGKVSPFEVEAAKTMANLSKEIKDLKFPIGAAFAVARGFFFLREWDEAIVAFKRVYGSPGSEDEINKYAPKALFELGKLLYDAERFLEATIAFGEICENFKDFVQISQAASMLRTSARKAMQAVKKSGKDSKFDEDLYKDSNELAGSAVPASLEKWKEVFRRAGSLAIEKNYDEAAERYESIPKSYQDIDATGKKVMKPIPFYAEARAQVGYCNYALYLNKLLHNDSEGALKLLNKAIEILENALNEATATERLNGEITARFYLGVCYSEDVWKAKEGQDKAKKALENLAPFKDRFEKNKQAQKYIDSQKYMERALAAMALANFKLHRYDKMHEAFLELEKKYPNTRTQENTAVKLYDLMKEQGQKMAAASKEDAMPYFEKAGYYIYSWYKAAKDRLNAPSVLGAGSALYQAKKYKEAEEVLRGYLAKLPKPSERSEEEKASATMAKTLLGEARYGMGEYKKAADLFDLLRRTVACKKCKTEKILEPQDYDKQPEHCTKESCKNDEKAVYERINENSLEIQEGAAKSYLAIYEKKGKTDQEALNKAQDIYQRIYNKLRGTTDKDLQSKFYEVLHTILKIWFYKRDFGRIVGDIRNMIMLSGGNPDNPSEDDWKKEFPVQPWRDKVRETFEAAKKAQGGK